MYDSEKRMLSSIGAAMKQLEDTCTHMMFRVARGDKFDSRDITYLVEDVMKADVILSEPHGYLVGELQDLEGGRYEPVPDPEPASDDSTASTESEEA